MPKTKCHKKSTANVSSSSSSSSSSNSSSCSLCSVTGLSSDSCSKSKDTVSSSLSLSKNSSSSCGSSSSSSCGSSSSSSCDTTSSSSCGTTSSSSCGTTSSSSCGTSSSSLTYSSCSSASSCSSSSSTTCGPCGKSSSNSSDTSCGTQKIKCEKKNYKECKELVKYYNKCKDVLKANSDMIVMLEFIKNKLIAVKPNIDCRKVQQYPIDCNIQWLESFVDTIFCVLRKNEAYKVIKVKDCKVKNCSDDTISDRLYIIKVKFENKGKVECKTLPLNFYWTRLTYNDSKSFKGILDYTISEIDNELSALRAQNTKPFLQ